MKNKDLR